MRIDGNVLLYATRDTAVADYYGENPFTTANDGIPLGGNIIEGFRGLPGDFAGSGQVRFEGRVDDMGTPATTDDDNINFHIVVGRTSSGQLSIQGGADLRDMDLIIGDSGMLNGQMIRGSGTVRIDGEGSLFNSNPFFLPYFPGQDPEMPLQPSKSPRADEDDASTGFDLYVGRGGTGRLQITAGGRAEIQDAVVVADQTGSVGTMIVDGFDSFLGSGGFDAGGDDLEVERHEIIIGRLGNGVMSITNGGSVYNVGPTLDNVNTVIAAVIGSDQPFEVDRQPQLAGRGTVTVDGIGSNWVLGGTLQIGGFFDSLNDADDTEDIEGDDAFYISTTGRGTLNIANGGLVSVISPSPDIEVEQPNQLDVVIGRFGELHLGGGSLDIQPLTMPSGTSNNLLDINRFRIINDGLISGSGVVSVGQFRNRALGQVRVGAGEKLLVASKGRFSTAGIMMDEEPLQNFGLIEVLGNVDARAELEFDRTPSVNMDEPVRPFLNQRQGTVTGNGGRTQGDIVAQYATLRFRSDLENHGNLTFTAGDNVVTGNVFNAAPAMMGDLGGVIFVSGNNTTVTFEDSIFNAGRFEIFPNASLVTALVDFSMLGSGSLSMTLGGSGNGQQVGHLSVVGDLLLDGLLEISLFASGTNPFSPQPGDTFEIMRAVGEMTGDFAAISLPFISPDVGLFAFPDYTLDAYFVTTLAAMAGSGSADLNGNGIVDDTDLAIWRQNIGNPGGLGDINGDGIVDGRDFFIWQMQASGFPGSGSISVAGAGALAGAVPEPASGALLAVGGLLALAWRRRGR